MKKIPLWPLYLADALAFGATFLIAFPYILSGEKMPMNLVLITALMILGAMVILCIPYILEFKNSKKSMQEDDKAGIEENLTMLFNQFASLNSKVENQDAKFSKVSAAINTLNENLSDKSILLKKHSLDVKEIFSKLEFLISKDDSAMISELENALRSDFNSSIKSLEDNLNDSISALEDSQKETEETVANLKNDLVKKEDLISLEENLNESLSELRAQIENDEEEIKSLEETSGILQKALSNSQSESTKSLMDKFISPENSEEEIEEESQEEELEETEENQEMENFEEGFDEEIAEEDSEEEDIDENDEDDFELDSFKESLEKEDLVEEKKTEVDLFAEEVPAVKKTSSKGNTVIIVNALIGIGNKPYLRGDTEPFNSEKGVPMEFSEIGKWKYECQSEETLNLSVWLNGTHQSAEGNFMVNPNEQFVIDATFENYA